MVVNVKKDIRSDSVYKFCTDKKFGRCVENSFFYAFLKNRLLNENLLFKRGNFTRDN